MLLIFRTKKISKETFSRAKVAKEYIERKYKVKKLEADIQKEEWDQIFRKMTEYQLNDLEKHQIKKEILHKENLQKRRM